MYGTIDQNLTHFDILSGNAATLRFDSLFAVALFSTRVLICGVDLSNKTEIRRINLFIFRRNLMKLMYLHHKYASLFYEVRAIGRADSSGHLGSNQSILKGPKRRCLPTDEWMEGYPL